MQSIPPNYPNMNGGYAAPVVHGYNSNNAMYPPGFHPQQVYHAPAQEIDSTRPFNELGSGEGNESGKGSMVELTSESGKHN